MYETAAVSPLTRNSSACEAVLSVFFDFPPPWGWSARSRGSPQYAAQHACRRSMVSELRVFFKCSALFLASKGRGLGPSLLGCACSLHLRVARVLAMCTMARRIWVTCASARVHGLAMSCHLFGMANIITGWGCKNAVIGDTQARRY